MVPQHLDDEIKKLRTKTNLPKHGWMKTQEGTTQHMMMLEVNRYRFNKSTSSCMATLDSHTKNHDFTTIKRYVRKYSSMTLKEALCGRQPDLFIYLYKLWQVYIMFFLKTSSNIVPLSSKCHNHMLYALNIYWVSSLLLDFLENL
jgi:hypothetical protein